MTSQANDWKKSQKKYLSFFHLFCVTLYAGLIESKEVDGARICSRRPEKKEVQMTWGGE